MLREIAALRTLAGTTGSASRLHRRLRRPRRARRGVLPDGGGRRLQPGQRHGRGVRARRGDATRRRACPTRRAWRSWATSHGRAGRWRSSSGRDPFWSARFRSFFGCSKAIGTSATSPSRWRRPSWRSGWRANRPPDGEPGIMHGDPHLSNVLLRRDRPELAAFVDWEMCTVGDPLLDLGLDVDLLAAGHEHDHRRGRAGRARRAGQPQRTARGVPGGRRPRNVRLDWYVAMACFKLGIVIEGTWSRYLIGQASREAGDRFWK